MLSRLAAAASLTFLAASVAPSAAYADNAFGKVTCGENGGPGCTSSATSSRTSTGTRRSTPASTGGAGNGCTGSECISGRRNLAWLDTQNCAWVPAGSSTSKGQWENLMCPGVTSGVMGRRFVPEGDEGAPVIPPIVVAMMARDRLRLPDPAIKSSPSPRALHLVRLPVWLYVSRSIWHPYEATATAGGVTATATATPATVTWEMGDGTEKEVCDGPGTKWKPGMDPRKASPTCGHTFTRASAGEPAEAFKVTATISWTITWSAAGTGGTFPPLTTSDEASFRVAESQALVTGDS